MYHLALLFFSGLRKLMFQYFTFGVGEYYRGIIKSAQVKQLQRYIPSLKVEDVERYVSQMPFNAISLSEFSKHWLSRIDVTSHSFSGSRQKNLGVCSVWFLNFFFSLDFVYSRGLSPLISD